MKFENIKDSLKTAGQKVGSAAGTVASGTKEVTSKTIKKFQERRNDSLYKKYNPLFPDEYADESFNLPNFVIIVDDAVRRNIEVCNGAIGWRSNAEELETLHLYDEFLPDCGLTFIPRAVCDTAYYVDPHNRNTFISIDEIMDYTNNAKMAELSNIAYCLGAKHYSIELVEKESTIEESSAEISAKLSKKKSGNASVERSAESESSKTSFNQLLSQGTYADKREAVRPTLKWFEHDPLINELVKNIVDQKATVDHKDIRIKGSSCATMSANVATKIESSLKKNNISSSGEFSKKSKKEHSYDLLFHIEF